MANVSLTKLRKFCKSEVSCGVLEEEAVRTIIETRWQLRRATLVDSELFQIYGNYKGQDRGVGSAFAQDATQGSAFSKLTQYQTFLLKKLRLAEQELGRLKSESAKVLSHSQPALVLNTPATEASSSHSRSPQWGVPLEQTQAAQLKKMGANIRRQRMSRGMTQERLAEAVDLNSRTVQKIEAGTTNILITTLVRIRKALKCPWEDLLGR